MIRHSFVNLRVFLNGGIEFAEDFLELFGSFFELGNVGLWRAIDAEDHLWPVLNVHDMLALLYHVIKYS
jgi:hypothetical protein